MDISLIQGGLRHIFPEAVTRTSEVEDEQSSLQQKCGNGNDLVCTSSCVTDSIFLDYILNSIKIEFVDEKGRAVGMDVRCEPQGSLRFLHCSAGSFMP